MTNRKGVFIGAYVPNELKESLKRRAATEHRTLSQEITRILVEAVHGQGLPSGSVDRRTPETTPRSRANGSVAAKTIRGFAVYRSGTKRIDAFETEFAGAAIFDGGACRISGVCLLTFRYAV